MLEEEEEKLRGLQRQLANFLENLNEVEKTFNRLRNEGNELCKKFNDRIRQNMVDNSG